MKRLTLDSGPPLLTEHATPLEASGTATTDLPHLKIALWWLGAWIVATLLSIPILESQGQVPIFFRAGATVALLLWAGPRHIPMALAVWIVSLLWVSQFPATNLPLTVGRALAIVGPYALGCMALRQMHFDLRMRRQKDAVLFLVVGVLLPAIPSAMAVRAMGFEVLSRSLPTAVSILSVVPFALTNIIPLVESRWGIVRHSSGYSPMTLWHLKAPAVIAGSAIAIGGLMWLAHYADPTVGPSIYFISFLPIAWVAVRYGVAITSAAIFATAFAVAALQTFAWPDAVLVNSRIATVFLSAGGLLLAAIEEERSHNADIVRRMAQIAEKSGPDFFQFIAKNLAETLEADFAMVCELLPAGKAVSLAVWKDGEPVSALEYPLEGTPCEKVTSGGSCVYPRNLRSIFPSDHGLARMGAEAYVGMPLRSSTGEYLGLMVVIYRRPLDATKWIEAGLAAFAGRTAAELERMHAEAALRYSEQRYRALVQNSRESVWLIEFAPPVQIDLPEDELIQRVLETGYVADANDVVVQMRESSSASTFVGMKLGQVAARDVSPLENIRDAVRNQFRFTQGIYAVHTEKGRLIHIRRSISPVIDNGRLMRVWGTAQEVTDLVRAQEQIRKLNAELEDTVARRTLELRSAVRELEAFSYSASHDLRAPLLGILGSSRVLDEDFRPALGREGQEWLDRLLEDAAYMDRLLDAMLGLARVSRAEVLWREIDLGEIARTVISNLA